MNVRRERNPRTTKPHATNYLSRLQSLPSGHSLVMKQLKSVPPATGFTNLRHFFRSGFTFAGCRAKKHIIHGKTGKW